jgi:hypothetical protein
VCQCPETRRKSTLTCPLAQSRSRPWMFQHAWARRGDERRRQHRVLSACRPLDKIIHRISNPGLKWLSTGESEGVPSCRSWISARDRQHSTTFSAEDKDLKHGNVLALQDSVPTTQWKTPGPFVFVHFLARRVLCVASGGLLQAPI